MRYLLFWDVTQHRMVVSYQCFLDCRNLKNGTSSVSQNVIKYQSTLHNVPEEQRSQQWFTLCWKFSFLFYTSSKQETGRLVAWLQWWLKEGLKWYKKQKVEKRKLTCQKFGLVNCIMQMIWRNRMECMENTGILKTWMKWWWAHCLSGFSNTEVTMYNHHFCSSWVLISVNTFFLA